MYVYLYIVLGCPFFFFLSFLHTIISYFSSPFLSITDSGICWQTQSTSTNWLLPRFYIFYTEELYIRGHIKYTKKQKSFD